MKKEALPARYGSDKSFSSAIYYLLSDDPDSFSALHRLPSDEIYHFYLGDPVEMLLLEPGGESRRVILGADILAGQQVQFVVPRGVWQGARLIAGRSRLEAGVTTYARVAHAQSPFTTFSGQARMAVPQKARPQGEMLRSVSPRTAVDNGKLYVTGTKHRQQNDIKLALDRWEDYQRRRKQQKEKE